MCWARLPSPPFFITINVGKCPHFLFSFFVHVFQSFGNALFGMYVANGVWVFDWAVEVRVALPHKGGKTFALP